MRSKIIILSSLLIACVLILIGIQKSLRQSTTSSIREYVRPETSSQKTEPESLSKSDATTVNHNQEKSLQKEVQLEEKKVTEKEIDEAVAPLEAPNVLSSTDDQTDKNVQKSTKPGDEEKMGQPASDDLMRTVTISGKEYQVKVGEPITVTHSTPGTWNPRPMTKTEKERFKELAARLHEESLSGSEIEAIFEELGRIAAETTYPGTATTTVRIVKNKK